MRIEIYDEGKQLKEIVRGHIIVQPKYYGIDTTDGHQFQEPFITLGIGTKEYWHCIIKFDNKQEAKELSNKIWNVAK